MKSRLYFVIIAALITGCSSTTISSPTATSSPSETATPAPAPTHTPLPTATVTPALPKTVEIGYDETIPEQEIDLVKTTVNQAYWFYVALGCSPKGFSVKITSSESGETIGRDAFMVGWDDPQTKPSLMMTRISHETAHIMCQNQLTSHPGDFRWLREGVANYFSALERIANSGMVGEGDRTTVSDHEIGMAEWISSEFCEFPLGILERPGVEKILPEFGGVGEVAVTLLTKLSPDGPSAVINYYVLKEDHSTEEAFRQGFGMAIEEFYRKYRDECKNGFPAIIPSVIPGQNQSTQVGQGCMNEDPPDQGLSIVCLGRMSRDSLPLELQERDIVYGFEVSGIDLSTFGDDLGKIVRRPHGFSLAFESNRVYIIIPPSTLSGVYFVTIRLEDGRQVVALYRWDQ